MIVDTVKLLRIRDENDNSGVNRALTPWAAWGEQTATTLIFIHHNRNAEGKYGDEVAGGHAWVGVLDTFLTIKRKSGRRDDHRRVVEGIGRVFEVRPFMYTFDTETRDITVLGSVDNNGIEGVKERVVKVMREAVDPLTTAEVRNKLSKPQPSKRQVLAALTELVEGGEEGLVRVPEIGAEVKGRTLVWKVQGKE